MQRVNPQKGSTIKNDLSSWFLVLARPPTGGGWLRPRRYRPVLTGVGEQLHQRRASKEQKPKSKDQTTYLPAFLSALSIAARNPS